MCGKTNKQTNRQTDKQTNRQTDKHPQTCSENKPFGNPNGCLAAITVIYSVRFNQFNLKMFEIGQSYGHLFGLLIVTIYLGTAKETGI